MGQLTCIICKNTISNEAAWSIHINLKKHKENKEIAKQQLEKVKSATLGQKRPASSFQEPQPAKKVKGILKNRNSQTALPSSQTKSQLLTDFFDNKSSSGLTNGNLNLTNASTSAETSESMIIEKRSKEGKKSEGKNNASVLPEGFFDDSVLDTQVRNVEDPKEEEFKKFNKEMKELEAQADQITEEDLKEAQFKRDMDEVQEELQNKLKITKLKEDRKTIVRPRREENLKEPSSSDDDDVEEFLDWRVKKF